MTDSPPPDYGHSPTPGKPPSGGGVREVTKDMPQFSHHPTVIPAQAGIRPRADFFAGIVFYTADAAHWIPVFTGMTLWVWQALKPSSPHIVTLGLDPRAHEQHQKIQKGGTPTRGRCTTAWVLGSSPSMTIGDRTTNGISPFLLPRA